jgi:hypothetical protein
MRACPSAIAFGALILSHGVMPTRLHILCWHPKVIPVNVAADDDGVGSGHGAVPLLGADNAPQRRRRRRVLARAPDRHTPFGTQHLDKQRGARMRARV